MKIQIKRLLTIGTLAAVVIIIDQLSKLAIRNSLSIRETYAPIEAIGSFFRIVHWKNTGVAFGLFQGYGWIMTLIGLIVLTLVVFFFKPVLTGPAFIPIAVGLQFGGAIGNLIDRFSLGYVVDFIWVGNFPVFNIADCAVVIGSGVLLIGLWEMDAKAEKKHPMTETGADGEMELPATPPEPASDKHSSYD